MSWYGCFVLLHLLCWIFCVGLFNLKTHILLFGEICIIASNLIMASLLFPLFETPIRRKFD